jgi:PncC family amidohydrolase
LEDITRLKMLSQVEGTGGTACPSGDTDHKALAHCQGSVVLETMPMSLTEGRLEITVGRLLREQGLSLAVAESCTGGLLSHRITNVPGSSDYYRGSITAYACDVKEKLLDVRSETLAEYGAVSEQTAQEMAEGVRRAIRADVGLAVTGIAGPTGGTPAKPVGLVHVALSAPDGEWVERYVWVGNRQDNKAQSADAALDLLRRYLEGLL